MTTLVAKNPLVQKIADGNANQELLDLFLSKQLPFTEEEYLESLVFLLTDEKLKDKSLSLLKHISESIKINYIEKNQANHRVAYFILLEALGKKNLSIVTKVIHNQSLPYEFLLKIAEKGDLAMLEALLDNQIKLIAYPQIMDFMELNPGITNYIRGRIQETRDFYLKEGLAEEIPLEDILFDVKEIFIEEAEEGEEGEELSLEVVQEKAQTELQMINKMSISERIRMALVGNKTQRAILMKCRNRMVMNAVIESPKLTKDEVIVCVRNKSIPGEVISKIANGREWTKNYQIVLGLVQNPKTPVKKALSFIKTLHLRDLQSLVKDRNISPVVRNLATNFYQQKTKVKG
ncbi:MAG: hypothetical protein KAT34_13415 [Candidatus Aminicenantes bacterium]|nr:hypothetical protein [Candidatus Aminicenantes bacterium]